MKHQPPPFTTGSSLFHVVAFAVFVSACASARDASVMAPRATTVCGPLSEDESRERCLDEAFELRATNPGAAIARFAEVCESGVTDACAEAIRLALDRQRAETTIRLRARAAAWCEGSTGSGAPDEALGRTCALAARSYAETAPADAGRAIELWRHACHVHAAIDACLVLSFAFDEPSDVAAAIAVHQRADARRAASEHAWHVASERVQRQPSPTTRTVLLPHGLPNAWWSYGPRLGIDPVPPQGDARSPAAAPPVDVRTLASFPGNNATDRPTCETCPSRCGAIAARCRAGESALCAFSTACLCACSQAAGGCGLPSWTTRECVSANVSVSD